MYIYLLFYGYVLITTQPLTSGHRSHIGFQRTIILDQK